MHEELEILAWMLLAGFVVAAVPFAWSRMRARNEGRYRKPRQIRETDPDDAYTC